MFQFGFRFLLAILTVTPIVVHSEPALIVGTWELTYVAPQDMMNTMPKGVTNQKLYFSDAGRLYVLAPDQSSLADLKAADYSLDGKRLKVTAPEAQQPREAVVNFLDHDTMEMTQSYEARRVFKRVKNFETKLEPQSLQLVAAGSRSEDSRYDSDDYAKLATPERAYGMWEVIAFERVPRRQLPPFGFFNDMWKIGSTTVTIYSRQMNLKDEVNSIVREKLTSSGVTLGGSPGSKIEWQVSFNEWGQLVLDSSYCRLILKRTTIKEDDIPSFPLKVVVTRFDVAK